MSAESPKNDVPMTAIYGNEVRVESGKWGSDIEVDSELEIGLILIELARRMPDYGEDDDMGVDAGKYH